ncbi:restriction endonuclease subunit S [Streptococcus suis]|uniref:restriction endonuclease subunit S n=1 Tax=Streptococcus suis TaxID=1307 RepID=UPI000C1864CC|nr:restriction endonuclease subunit S [Streptococcus suis]
MPNKDKNIPKRRFKTFENDPAWELRKLGEVVEVCSGRDYKHLGVGSIPVYGTGGYMLSVSEALSKNNDAIGIGRKGTIDSPYILRAPFWTVDTLFYCIPNDGFTLEFAYSIFQNINWKSMDESTGVPSLSKNGINNVKVLTPKIKEQSAIGTFFSTLDRHITLHQRKLDKLKSVKQAYLSEMFPAEGERVPKRRFPGFTDDWELRKLGEVARFRRGSFPQPYGNSEWYDGDGAMPFVQVADVTDEMNLVGDTKQKISRKAQPLSVFAEEGSVLVTLQGSIGRVAITQYEAFIDRTVLIFENFNLPVDNLFWAYIIKQKFIEEAKCAPGGTIKTITKEVLSDFDIKLPSHPEQSAIGSFFSTLDRHITLHQRKLEKLKNLKKALLNELFV